MDAKNATNLKFILGMAWKNLARHKKRTLITASAIAFGLALYVFVDGWLLGAELDSQRNLRWYETSSARVYADEGFEERDRLLLSNAIENPAEVVSAIEALGFSASPRTSFRADAVVQQNPYPTDGSMTVRAYGIDLQRDEAVYQLQRHLAAGRYPEAGEYGVVLGAWLAEELEAQPGYPLTLVTRTRQGYYQTWDLTVTGILDTPNPIVNRTAVYLPLEVVDQELQMEGAVTEINIRMPELANVPREAAAIQAAISGAGNNGSLEVYTWEELASDYMAMASTKRGGTSIILLLGFIIAAVGISNTMLMVIFERTKEMGTLRAIGMRNRDIALMFLVEAGGIGFIGSVVGLALGSIMNFFMVQFGVDFGWVLREMDVGYRLTNVMYGAWNPPVMLIAFFSGILISAFVAIFPTRRALKIGITDCLRDD